MPKGEHFKKVTKKDKSFIIRFTTDEMDSLNQVCSLLNTTKTDFIRTTLFKAIAATLPPEQPKPLPDSKNAIETIISMDKQGFTRTEIIEYLKTNNYRTKNGGLYKFDNIRQALWQAKRK